jgi:hypothetical protein
VTLIPISFHYLSTSSRLMLVLFEFSLLQFVLDSCDETLRAFSAVVSKSLLPSIGANVSLCMLFMLLHSRLNHRHEPHWMTQNFHIIILIDKNDVSLKHVTNIRYSLIRWSYLFEKDIPYKPEYKASFFYEIVAQKSRGRLISEALHNFPVTHQGHVIS